MDATLTAIEMTGTIDEQRHLTLDGPMPIPGPMRVRVIVLYPTSDEGDEAEWLKSAANNPAFADFFDPEEDIYSLTDGAPFDEQA